MNFSRLLRTLVLSAALFALLGLGAKSARAQNSTTLSITNSSQETLTYVGIADWNASNGWSNQTWETDGYSVPSGSCTDPDGNLGLWYPGGPPTTISPGEVVCFGSVATCPTCGTGGTITYSIGLSTSGSQPPEASASFAWTSPKDSDSFGGNNSSGVIAWSTIDSNGSGLRTVVTGTTENGFTVGEQSPNGGIVQWSLSESSLASKYNPTFMSGYPGQSITFNGGNFDTTGQTQVLFGGESAVTTCASATECTAVVPYVGGLTGAIPVVVSVYGETASLGSFTFLPAGPACQYYGLGTEFGADCTFDSLNDPVLIFQQVPGGWTYITNYPQGDVTSTPILSEPVGTTETFVGCFSVNGTFPYPGQNGCDAPTTITSSPTPTHHPR